jgi:DNA-binding transcriptional LysR family regulator
MHCLYSDKRLDLIEDEIDIAFRMGSLPDRPLNARKISEKQRTLTCSPEYYAKHPVPKKPEDLVNWNLITHDMLPNSRTLLKAGNQTYNIELKGNISANSAEAMVKFATYGLGISTVGHWLIEEELADGRLIKVLPDWEVEPMPLYAVWHGNITECSNTRLLLNFLKNY